MIYSSIRCIRWKKFEEAARILRAASFHDYIFAKVCCPEIGSHKHGQKPSNHQPSNHYEIFTFTPTLLLLTERIYPKRSRHGSV